MKTRTKALLALSVVSLAVFGTIVWFRGGTNSGPRELTTQTGDSGPVSEKRELGERESTPSPGQGGYRELSRSDIKIENVVPTYDMLVSRIAEDLSMTKREAKVLGSIIERFAVERSLIESRLLEVDGKTDSHLFLSIGPYPKVGEKMKADLYNEIEASLGAEFSSKLRSSQANQHISRKFGYFGRCNQTIDFEAYIVNGTRMYGIEREYTLGKGQERPVEADNWLSHSTGDSVVIDMIVGTEYHNIVPALEALRPLDPNKLGDG